MRSLSNLKRLYLAFTLLLLLTFEFGLLIQNIGSYAYVINCDRKSVKVLFLELIFYLQNKNLTVLILVSKIMTHKLSKLDV